MNGDEVLGVREAARRLQLHENTIRNWVRDGQLEDVRVPGSRFLRVRATDVERLVKQRGSAAPTLESERRVTTAELVTATELAQWPDTRSRDAQALFPDLIRRLLLETAGVTDIRVEVGDGVAQPGFDGVATAEPGSVFVPPGRVVFELGTSKDIKGKADKEFTRVAGRRRDETAFVFATPRRWNAGAAWARDRQAHGPFDVVRVIDAVVLEAWLLEAPGAHRWISEHLGLRPRHASTLDSWWGKLSASTDPRLPTGLFGAGRDGEIRRLAALFAGLDPADIHGSSAGVPETQRYPVHIVVATETDNDGFGFIREALRSADLAPLALPTALMVESVEAWASVCERTGRSLLIPTFEGADVDTALNAGHDVVTVVDGSHVRPRKVDIQLPRLGRREMADAFVVHGYQDLARADRLAVEIRRSLPAFLRQHSRDPRRNRPDWAAGDAARVLAPLALIQEWTEDDHDMAAIERLTGMDRHDVEVQLRRFASGSDRLLRRSDTAWAFTSPEEAFLMLEPSITTTHLRVWRELAEQALLETDPFIGLGDSDRVLAQFQGQKRRFSSRLRNGIATGVALAGSLPTEGYSDIRTAAEDLTRRLLEGATGDSSGATWTTLARCLPALAEGAPEVFLRAVENDLMEASPTVRSSNTGLLWALETICWSDEYLVRGVMVLGRLPTIELDESSGTKPAARLASILSGWVRHTSATAATKLDALDALLRTVEDIGWTVLLSLMPSSTRSVSWPPARPRFREWEPDRPGVAMAEWADFVKQLVDRAVHHSGTDPKRLASLARRMSALPTADRARVLDHLVQVIESDDMTGDQRLVLWESLRELVSRHKRFPDADWSLPAADLERLENLASILTPDEDPRRWSRLFDWQARVDDVADDYEDQQRALEKLRRAAVEDIWASPDRLDVLAGVARGAKHIELLGAALADAAVVDEDALIGWLDSADPVLAQLARTWARNQLHRANESVLQRLLDHPDLTAHAREQLVLSVPVRATMWRVLDRDPSDAHLYWTRGAFEYIPSSDALEAVARLLAAGRAWTAVAVCSYAVTNSRRSAHASHEDRPGVSAEVVTKVLTVAGTEQEPHDGDVSAMTAHYVSELLTYLSDDGMADEQLAALEFLYLRIVDDYRSPAALNRVLAATPDLFIELVRTVFRPRDDDAEPATDDNRATQSWWVLHEWTGFPGKQDNDAVDAARLDEWVRTARLELSGSGHGDIGDEMIGQALARTVTDADGIWPAEPVRDLVETIGSRHFENGLVIGKLNLRGVTTRGVYDGGTQEHDLGQRYRQMARQTASRWPRTSRILRDIATSYERDAERQDREADRNADRR